MSHKYQSQLQNIINSLDNVILGKREQIKLSLTCILAEGHLLIEDMPGVGKTTLANNLAKILGLDFKRIQFTSDLLPADLIGISVWSPSNENFIFHKGAIFSSILLADEINRASPRTQSALLEAMEEKQVSENGITHKLPKPFMVIATQNSNSFVGTNLLPEAQLDRFLLSISLGLPNKEAEKNLLKGKQTEITTTLFNKDDLLKAQLEVKSIYVSDALIDYLQNLAEATRMHPNLNSGLSPRGLLGLLNASKAFAYIENREMVLPEDVQNVFTACSRHRVIGMNTEQTCIEILNNTKIP